VADSIDEYLIDQSGLDWPAILAGWSCLLPPEFILWLVNRLGDLFLVTDDGAVQMLDVGAGTLKKLAESRADFCRLVDEREIANDWLAIPLVDEMVASGMRLKPGQCYGFKTPPVLGGQYAVENLGPLSIADFLGAYSSIHEPIRNLPDGSQVVLKMVD